MVAIISGVLGLIMGTVGLLVAIFALVEVMSFKKSTHKIQYVPLDPGTKVNDEGYQEFTEEQLEDIEKEDFIDFEL